MSVCLIRYIYLKRMQARLQEEVSALLFEYVPLEGFEMETIHFNDGAVTNNPRDGGSKV